MDESVTMRLMPVRQYLGGDQVSEYITRGIYTLCGHSYVWVRGAWYHAEAIKDTVRRTRGESWQYRRSNRVVSRKVCDILNAAKGTPA